VQCETRSGIMNFFKRNGVIACGRGAEGDIAFKGVKDASKAS